MKMKTTVRFSAFLFLIICSSAHAQFKLPGAGNPDVRQALEKVIGDYSKDFATLKGALDRILRRAGVEVHYTPSEVPRLHPTRQARLMFDGRIEAVGEIGQIHPRIAAEAGLPEETMLASLDLRAAFDSVSEARSYRAFARTPGTAEF